MTNVVTIFLHIPRTGGTTFRRLMDAAYARCIRVGPEFNNRLADAVEPDAMAYYGHSHYGLHFHIPPGPYRIRYVTLLRDPVERLRSQARNRGTTVADLLACWPEQKNMAVRMLGLGAGAGSYHADQLTEQDLICAKARLRAYFEFGFTEHLDEFAHRVLGFAPGLVPLTVPHLNASESSNDDHDDVPDDAVNFDAELLSFARELHARQ